MGGKENRMKALAPVIEDDSFDYDEGIRTETKHNYWYACPVCHEEVALNIYGKGIMLCDYCPYCGQKLDWSDIAKNDRC